MEKNIAPVNVKVSELNPIPWMQASERDHFLVSVRENSPAWEEIMSAIERMPDINSLEFYRHGDGGKFNQCNVSLKHKRDGRSAETVRREVGKLLCSMDCVEHVEL